jgi:hypothetical protein
MKATSGHAFWAAANAAKLPIADGDGGCAMSTGARESTVAAEQTSTEGKGGRIGVGKGESTIGDKEAEDGDGEAAATVAVGRLNASATKLLAPGVWGTSVVNSVT